MHYNLRLGDRDGGLAGSATGLAATAPVAIFAFFAVYLTIVAIGTIAITRTAAAERRRLLWCFRHRTNLSWCPIVCHVRD